MRSIKLPSWIDRALGTAPRPRTPHAFAIEEDAVRYVCRSAVEERLRLEDTQSATLVPGTFSTGPIGGAVKEYDAFRATLAELVDRCARRPSEATLVLPDRWLRVVLCSASGVPSVGNKAEEAWRWKLRQLVPFRVEELRVTAAPAAPDGAGEPRLAIGFGIEMLLSQIEAAFTNAGIRLGVITAESLASAPLVAAGEGLSALVSARERDYSVSVWSSGMLALHRYKETAGGAGAARRAELVRELRLTRAFVAERGGGRGLEASAVLGSAGIAEWASDIGEALAAPCRVVDRESLGWEGNAPELPWPLLVAMVASTLWEVG